MVIGTSFLGFYRYQWTMYSFEELKMLEWLFNKVGHDIVIDDIAIFILFRIDWKNEDIHLQRKRLSEEKRRIELIQK